MEIEIWVPIPSYQGIYEISDLSRVWSHPRKPPGNKSGVRRGRILKTHLTGSKRQYLAVNLYRNGIMETRLVHQLVLEAFVDLRPPGYESRHGEFGTLDDRLVNLCYGTSAENKKDMIRDGTKQQGDNHGSSKLTSAIVIICRQRYRSGENCAEMAREHGVTRNAMWRAVTRRTWRCIP